MSRYIEDLISRMNNADLYTMNGKVSYDPMDMALPEPILNAKRIMEFIYAQPVFSDEGNRFTGMLRLEQWDGDVPADIFHRCGHKWFARTCDAFYNHYLDNLAVFEWQHTAPNFEKILTGGLIKQKENVEYYKTVYRDDRDKTDFLTGMRIVLDGVEKWANICAEAHEEKARACADPTRRGELLRLAAACRRVPLYPAESFYEGLHCLIFCFQFLPDSIGTMDRYLYPLYRQDIDAGKITRDEAKELIQEVFVHLCAHTPVTSKNYSKSAECHFAIGGYTADGEDGFNDLSRLIVEALMEIDTRRPEITLRWTKKTPFEILRYVLDCERHDANKRIAIASDEPRIAALTDIAGLPFEEAVRYTMVGCNEPSFPGTVWYGGSTNNIVRSLTNTFRDRRAELIAAEDYDAFFAIYRQELDKDLHEIIRYADAYNDMRAKDWSMLSNFLLDGPIENATPANRFSCTRLIGGFDAMGTTCVIDSLAIIRQFVYEEKRTTMAHLLDVLEDNWACDEELHAEILRRGRFFGNADPLSDDVARQFTTAMYEILHPMRMKNGAPILVGTLNGYNPHNTKFGELTGATPDGRYAGEGFMIGTGQANGKDRNGLLPLLRSVAQFDPHHIFCGPQVCNLMLDEAIVRDDAQFDKLCRTLETYFRLGGLHAQLNYVSREELQAARRTPEQYGSLKVRVSGFSAPYVHLCDEMQEEILQRTMKNG